MSGEFSLRVREWAEKAMERADTVVRQVHLEVGKRIIARSVVDTGRFRHSWRYGIDEADLSSTPEGGTTASPLPAPAIGIVPKGQGMGHKLYWTNSLPYSLALEYGHSRRMPLGVVRITVLEFQSIVSEAASAYAGIGVLGSER